MPTAPSASPHHAHSYAIVLGRLLTAMRDRRRWTQRRLADAVESNQSAICRLERGDAGADDAQLARIAEAFGMTPAALQARTARAWDRTGAAVVVMTGIRPTEELWWEVAWRVAGPVGIAGLADFVAAVILLEEEPEAQSTVESPTVSSLA